MRPLREAAAFLGLVIATGWSGQAWAWGDLGHKIICEVAFQELNGTARFEVRRLIRLDPDFSFFSDSCTWPDHPRRRASEHVLRFRQVLGRTMSAGVDMPLHGDHGGPGRSAGSLGSSSSGGVADLGQKCGVVAGVRMSLLTKPGIARSADGMSVSSFQDSLPLVESSTIPVKDR
jgi:S1/P1 Nuclease